MNGLSKTILVVYRRIAVFMWDSSMQTFFSLLMCSL